MLSKECRSVFLDKLQKPLHSTDLNNEWFCNAYIEFEELKDNPLTNTAKNISKDNLPENTESPICKEESLHESGHFYASKESPIPHTLTSKPLHDTATLVRQIHQ